MLNASPVVTTKEKHLHTTENEEESKYGHRKY